MGDTILTTMYSILRAFYKNMNYTLKNFLPVIMGFSVKIQVQEVSLVKNIQIKSNIFYYNYYQMKTSESNKTHRLHAKLN